VDALSGRCATAVTDWYACELALLRDIDEMSKNADDLNRQGAKTAKGKGRI
jgi:hypothetical protein